MVCYGVRHRHYDRAGHKYRYASVGSAKGIMIGLVTSIGVVLVKGIALVTDIGIDLA